MSPSDPTHPPEGTLSALASPRAVDSEDLPVVHYCILPAFGGLKETLVEVCVMHAWRPALHSTPCGVCHHYGPVLLVRRAFAVIGPQGVAQLM
jgi:hypothetical protein